ncbi:MAG: LCP family protein [Eubacteriales bacterium]|nr:LCP family protein [Eubacteriales bacterium]
MKKSTKFIAGVVSVLLILVLLGGSLLLQQREDGNIVGAGTSEHALQKKDSLEYNGKTYPLKRHIRTLLVMGTDKFNPEEDVSGLFYNYQQADFQTVLIFDQDKKTCTPIQINRDTMCDVPWLSVNGKVGGTKFCQIALSHTYGSGAEDSCVNSRNAISSLMFDAPIDHYVSFSLDSIQIINDLVGGVTVTVPDNAIAYADPDFVEGNTVLLQGDKAMKFVRTRDKEVFGSNIDRMSHQRVYLGGFVQAARECYAEEDEFSLKAYDQLSPYMVTDLSLNDLNETVQMLVEYEILPIETPKGELKLGTQFAEYYIDYDSLWDLVKNAYCT